jgi:hypothetical protein
MAGEWISVRVALPDDPIVHAIADFLSGRDDFRRWLLRDAAASVTRDVTRDVTARVMVCVLVRFWGQANEFGKVVGDDLVIKHCDLGGLDRLSGVPGFGAALDLVDWAVEGYDERGRPFVTLPKFLSHNTPASERTPTGSALRMRRKRARDAAAAAGAAGVTGDATGDASRDVTSDGKKRTEQKRTPRKKTPKAPAMEVGGGRFSDFWQAWPANDRKQDKAKCLAKWIASGCDAVADQIIADVAIKTQSRKWRDGYIEAPEVYLNNRRWEDGQQLGADDLANPWHETQSGIRRKGEELGLGDWDEQAFHDGRGENFITYRTRVYRAAGHTERANA